MDRRKVFLAIVVAAMAFAVFWPIARHEFLNYDDGDYVTENPHVAAGLTTSGMAWAFTATRSSNWHPLTWLSHMLDVQLFGLDAGRHHTSSLVLHLVSTVLLFLVVAGMTGAVWRSALVAALFAVHPLHVESVAWVAERKDVLSGLFWMLTMGAYWHYARKPSVARYVTVFLCLALGLMAKPMLVTLPFVLLLLDYWPLRRLAWAGSGAFKSPDPTRRAIVEKIPLVALCAASSVVTYWAQQVGGSINLIHQQQLGQRFGNAFLSYATYVGKTLWPSRLAVFYPLPRVPLPLWEVALAALLVAGVSVVVIRQTRKRPYLVAGWAWYVGTLVPVIGLVQVGEQALADRYMYLPMTGLSLVGAWGAAEAAGRGRFQRAVLGSALAIALLSFMGAARAQVGRWRDSTSLFRHALAVTEGNYVAHANLGRAMLEAGRLDESVGHLQEALAISPLPKVMNNLGIALRLQGRTGEALAQFTRVLELEPGAAVLANIGLLLYEQGDLPEAVARYRQALRLDPGHAQAHNNLGAALWALGRRQEAMDAYRDAIRAQPGYLDPVNNLGNALLAEGRPGEAADLFRQVLQLDPVNARARSGLARATGGVR